MFQNNHHHTIKKFNISDLKIHQRFRAGHIRALHYSADTYFEIIFTCNNVKMFYHHFNSIINFFRLVCLGRKCRCTDMSARKCRVTDLNSKNSFDIINLHLFHFVPMLHYSTKSILMMMNYSHSSVVLIQYNILLLLDIVLYLLY